MKIITFHTPSGTKQVPCPYTEKADVIEWIKECYPFNCRYIDENEL